MRKSVAQIIAQAICDAGASVVTNVPGFGGTQVFDAFREISSRSHPNSFHEFEVFQTLRGEIVTGDTGVSTLFAFPPYNCVDICTYMGGSVPLAVGAYLAGRRNVWAVTGDFSFIAAGHLGLLEAVQRDIPLKVLIFYNRRAQTTGGQPILDGMLERTLEGYESYVRHINDPQDGREIEAVLRETSSAQEMRIVVADYGEG